METKLTKIVQSTTTYTFEIDLTDIEVEGLALARETLMVDEISDSYGYDVRSTWVGLLERLSQNIKENYDL